jgi:hypothetical protein
MEDRIVLRVDPDFKALTRKVADEDFGGNVSVMVRRLVTAYADRRPVERPAISITPEAVTA